MLEINAVQIVLVIIAIVSLIVGIVKWSDKKTDVGKYAVGLAGVLLLVTFFVAPATGVAPSTTTDDKVSGGTYLPIQEIVGTVTEEFTGAKDAVNGTIYFYEAGVNPADADVDPIDSITVTNGDFNYSGKKIQTDTKYLVVFDGASYYAITLKDHIFPSSQYDPNNGVVLWEFEENARKLASFVTLLQADDTQSGVSDSNTVGNDVNEIVTDGSGGIIYDESDGDGTYTVRVKIGASGANSVADKVVFGIAYDDTTPPEGNEVTDMSASRVSGDTFAGLEDITADLFNNEGQIDLGSIKGGRSGTYDITISVNESAVDADDDFSFYVDDLGGDKAKDVLNNRKATKVSFNVDARA